MPTSEHLLVILYLLPGFLAARVFVLVAVQRSKTPLGVVTEVVLFEFLVLAVDSWFAAKFEWAGMRLPIEGDLGTRAVDSLRWNAPSLTLLGVIAISLGAGIGWLHNIDQPWKFLRSFGMTRQSSHATVWQGAFHARGTWVIVHLEKGERILGWPELYADTPEEGSVFLADAAYLDEEDRHFEVEGPGVLLTKSAGIRMVEFLRKGYDARA